MTLIQTLCFFEGMPFNSNFYNVSGFELKHGHKSLRCKDNERSTIFVLAFFLCKMLLTLCQGKDFPLDDLR